MARKTKIEKPLTRAQKRRIQTKFLAALADTCNVTRAQRVVADYVSRRSLYLWKENDEEFSKAWDDAVDEAVDELEFEARRRALKGVEKPIFYKGEQVTVVREYSDRMMEVLLMAHRPEKYRARTSMELTGPGGGPVRTISTEMTPKEAAEAYAASLNKDG